MTTMSSLPPIFYHYFSTPLPYARTLSLQEYLHKIQLTQRRAGVNYKDLLLLLQHRPVYTAGRRQVSSSPEVVAEAARLRDIGADFVATQRGGETTYHGPGQIVGYPLLDLGRWSPPLGIREYICKMQKTLEAHLLEAHGIRHYPSEHTGVFLNDHTKIASIGVQVRHRLTTHGFSLNITREPLAWFSRVVACGLAGVDAGCIADATTRPNTHITVETEVDGLVTRFGKMYGRDMAKLNMGSEEEVVQAIRAVEKEAKQAEGWLEAPTQ
ncbi:chloroplast lipoate protein ligase [Laetiporus sulphureus 93-53]|uniref:lipoyl(octanoyl) transferase n=1 Tax=Laetiporus sulphureus 93-53 TaxID=1314785 RepID=A0A165E4S4_9APHY|nr:chloroplast lipoate protein ligase [Laetiporus sulphureus 93-53]KZT06238.1 chloroplast lipoate protein ligase [Laetiporus sulphureus 93-53]